MDDGFTHVWRSIPCSPIGPEETHESGRVFVKVRTLDDFEEIVPVDELVLRPNGVEHAEPETVESADSSRPTVAAGAGAGFADVTNVLAFDPRRAKLQRFNALLAQIKALDAGDDETLAEIIKTAVTARLSETQVESLVAAGARKTKTSLKRARVVAEKQQEALSRQDEGQPDARAERERIAAEKEERERDEKAAELARLYASVSHIALSPALLADMESLVHRLGVIAEGASIRGTYLAATSRLLKGRAISYFRRGAPSSGKNYLVSKTLDLIPPESTVRISASSEKALIYMGDGPEDRDALKHKILVIPEAASLARKANGDESAAAGMLRTFLSEGRIDYPVVVLTRGDAPQTIHIVRDGPICAILTSARDDVEDELMTRLLIADADESAKLTRQVVKRAWIGDPDILSPSEFEIAQWVDFQRWLAATMPPGGYEAVIPFADAVDKAHARLIERDRNAGALRARRDTPAFVAAVAVSSVLNKAQRRTDRNGAIVATLDDYRHAHEAFDAGMAAFYAVKSADNLSTALAAIAAVAADQGRKPGDKDNSFKVSVGAVATRLGLSSNRTVDARIKKLIELGAIEVDPERRGGRGSPFHYRILKETLDGATGHVFPTVEEVEAAIVPDDGPGGPDDGPSGCGECEILDAASPPAKRKSETVSQRVDIKDEVSVSVLSPSISGRQKEGQGEEGGEDLRPTAVMENSGRVNVLSQGDISRQKEIELYSNDLNSLTVLSPFSVSGGKGDSVNLVSAIAGVEVVFAQTIAGAKALIAQMIVDAGGAPIALDLETAPLPAERAKLQALVVERQAAANRKTAANREIRKTEKSGQAADTLCAEVTALEARLKRLDKQIEIAETAALDPRRASIRLCQVYGGGRRCGIIDVAKASELALASLNGVAAVIHNASFDCAFLARAGVMLGEVHDTLQASKLALGDSRSSLAQAVAHFCDHAIDKEEQASDWGGSLTPSKIAYAARDIIWLWRLAQRIYPDPADSADLAGLPARRRGLCEVSLADQAEAYKVANAAVPSFVKLNARGVMFDPAAHEEVLRALADQDAAASDAYLVACRELGRDDLAERVPRTDAETAMTLKALLSESELSTWPRVDKPWGLSIAKSELRKAAHYTPVVAMIGLAEARLARSQWGATLPLMVAADGRLYPNYRVAGTASGRSTCASPNIQGAPRDPRFRRMFIAAPGCTFVAADYGSMDLRTAAYFFEDATLARLFTLDGVDGDPHALMASRVTGKAPEEVTPEERSKAKGCNFGSLYGIQALALIEQIWKLSPDKPIRVTAAEAQDLLDAFARTYPDLTRHRGEYAVRCMREGRIVIGRDRFATTGRIIPFRRLRRDQNPTTCSFAYPIQGLNAIICMRAMTRLDRALIEQRVDGGLAIFNHDEFVLEVREADAERAGALLKDAMESAFVEMFPSATLNKLVEVKTGANWAATKEKKAEPESQVEGPSARSSPGFVGALRYATRSPADEDRKPSPPN